MNQTPARADRSAATAAVVVAAVALGVAGGCQTVGEDLADFAESLAPITWSEAARMAVDFSDPDRRRKGVLLLSNSTAGGSELYLEMYRKYAEIDPDPLVRAVSIRALARHGAPEDAMIIANNLRPRPAAPGQLPRQEAPQVRWEAARGLQRMHNPEVVPVMLEVLRDEVQPAGIRAAIARGLGQYAQDRVFQGLVAGLDAWELSVNRAAARSLRDLTGVDRGVEPAAWLSWYDEVGEGQDPFAGKVAYVYPTYTREETLLEKMSFWHTHHFERPGTPVGMRPPGERSTYGEEGN